MDFNEQAVREEITLIWMGERSSIEFAVWMARQFHALHEHLNEIGAALSDLSQQEAAAAQDVESGLTALGNDMNTKIATLEQELAAAGASTPAATQAIADLKTIAQAVTQLDQTVAPAAPAAGTATPDQPAPPAPSDTPPANPEPGSTDTGVTPS